MILLSGYHSQVNEPITTFESKAVYEATLLFWFKRKKSRHTALGQKMHLLPTDIPAPHMDIPFSLFLESENLVLELTDGTSLGEAETLGSLLQAVNHRRGTTEENLDIAGGLGEVLLVHGLASAEMLLNEEEDVQ